MLIKVEQREHTDRLNRISKHDVLYVKCDVCGKEWESRGSKTRIISRKVHVCSLTCKRLAHQNGGVIERQRAATCIERYGAENPFAAEVCKQKMIKTWQTKYGVSHARSSEHVKQKVRQTMLERYGVENPMNSSELHERQVRSMQQNWGVLYPMQLSHVREAMMSGSIVKFGVPFPMQSTEFQKYIFEQRDGINWMSKPERAFRLILEERYGKENVRVQQLLEKKWSIDFYIKSIDTWISFDGVYWHGLDRPIEEIRKSCKVRDQAIYKKWIKDRELDEYMAKKGLRLIRITDKMFLLNSELCIEKINEGVV